MDTDTRTTSDREVTPGESRFQRKSSWADVEVAQADMQRRFRPLWWVYLGMFGVITGAYSLLFASYDTAPMLVALFMVLFIVIPLVPSLRHVIASTMQAGFWAWLIPMIVIFASVYLAAFLRSGTDESARLPPPRCSVEL